MKRSAFFLTASFLCLITLVCYGASPSIQDEKPVIGISTSSCNPGPGACETYVTAVEKAGGTPVLLPLINDVAVAEELVAKIDGLIMTGGEDVAPAYYGEEVLNETVSVNGPRDTSDFLLIGAARRRNIPVLGICRGEQEVNVFYGGSLVQDIPSQVNTNLSHRQSESSDIGTHAVCIERGTRLHDLLGVDTIMVNSFHHQAVKDLSPSFRVSARALDGVVEAYESVDGASDILCVQFHPESLIYGGDDTFLPIFTGFIQKAADNNDVKTTFQTAAGWRPLTDIRSDAVMVYGVGGTFEERLRSWREHGYRTHFMTGIAWGGYQDYFTGKWDGKTHFDEGQMDAEGNVIWHNPSVPYIVPTENYLDYFKATCIKRVIDAGVDHIFLEEPEFWAFGGYSDAFKKEWQDYYGFEWRPQHESPENTYLSNKLKYHLYYRALEEVFTYAKEYGKSRGRDVKCYVPTHSLINYSQWQIVSPEASLASLSCLDGYIAQVWTGTSRTPIYLNGEKAERVFETAYLEYSSMESMTAPTGRKMFFLTDPIEDAAHDWADYKKNYEATFTAQLLLPLVSNYEVMPWPDRIYGGLFNTGAGSQEKTHIPRSYSTQMQVMVNALNKMPYSENHVSGPTGITVLTGNSMMFQRFPTHQGYEDPQLSNFFGMALPLVKRGIPVKTAHIENMGFPESLADTRVLLMSYANMKPLEPKAHGILAEWVKRGGIIIYSGRDDDPFQSVREWWNMDGNSFNAPSDHLFSLMGLEAGVGEGIYRYGKGRICVLRHDPKEYVMTEGGDRTLLDALRKLYGAGLKYKNSFLLHRGVYDVASVMAQSVSDNPMVLKGKLIDLYDPELPVCDRKVIMPGQQALLVDVDRVPDPGKPQVLAAAARESDEIRKDGFYSMVFKSPVNTTNVARVLLPSMPVSVKIDGVEAFSKSDWHAPSRTYLLNFENSPDGVRVEIRY